MRVVRIRLDQLSLQRPQPWGGCWHALGSNLQVLVTQRLLAPGSEWHLHRAWFGRTALADLRGGDFGLAEIHKLYATLDQVLPLQEKLFDHSRDRWRDLFGAN